MAGGFNTFVHEPEETEERMIEIIFMKKEPNVYDRASV